VQAAYRRPVGLGDHHYGLCLDAIRIRAFRGETDETDLDRYFAIAFGHAKVCPIAMLTPADSLDRNDAPGS
jgi:hypothetical protein